MSRFDVVVLGATGVTGRRTIPYLAQRARVTGRSWAIAGRRPQKLMQLLAGLPFEGQPEVLEADVEDASSLAAIARDARVVVNAVGPYRWSAPPVIAACIDAGAHYLDMTGETDVVAGLLDHHEAARRAGVKIVQAAGYEALPFDLAVALAGDLAEDRGARLASADVTCTVRFPPGLPRPSDGVSGGTFASTVEALREADLRTLLDPAALVRAEDADEVRRANPLGPLPMVAGGRALIPMLPTPFANPAVVHRTQSLLRAEGRGATPDFRYREGISLGDGPLTLPAQLALAGPMTAAVASSRLMARLAPAPVRRGVAEVLERLGPDAGDGPDEDRLEGWRWRLDVEATATDGQVDRVTVDASGHPGYLATSRMIAEAALLLADPEADVPDRAGCLTPALALGTAELDRFAEAQVRFLVG